MNKTETPVVYKKR